MNKKEIIPPEDSCISCKHKKEGNFCSTDGWDRMEDWFCTHPKAPCFTSDAMNEVRDMGEKIQGAVEWHEEKYIAKPDWCPLWHERGERVGKKTGIV